MTHALPAKKPDEMTSSPPRSYGLAGTMLIAPSGWTLTEATREVRLPR